jgi:hypothetical protein
MGSTSQGYQQMPFFGGFAASGGAINGYDEGLGGARMGGAVDEAGDYSRGGYAYGGDAGFEDIVAQHRAGVMPRMEDVAFPTVEMRAGEAPKLEPLPERQQGLIERGLKGAMSDPSGTYEKAKGLGSGLKTGYKFLSEGPGALMGFAEGGDVHNNAMQDLLSNPIQVSKPQQPQQAPQEQKSGLLGGLMKAGAGMAANYFLPGSGPLVSAGLGAMGMAAGGRAAFQEGGPSEDDFFKRGIQGAESAHRQFDKYGRTLTSPKGAEGISQIMPGTGPEAAKLAGLPYDRQRLRTDEEYNTALGNAYYNKQLKDFGTEELAAAAYNAGPGRVRQALARAEREGGDVMSYLPAETRNYVPTVMRKAGLSQDSIGEKIAGLGPRDRSMMALYPEAKSAPAGVVPGERGIGSGQVSDKGFLERVEERPERLIIPILQGLGAMAGSKNRYALGALAEGLGAGAGSYMDMQQKEADILKRRQEAATEAEETRSKAAGVGQTEAMTGFAGAQTLETLQKAKNLGFQNFGSAENPNWWATLADGSMKPLYEWTDSQEPLAGGSAAAELANQLYRSMKVSPGARQPAESADTAAQPTTKSVTPKVAEPQEITPIPGVVFDDGSRNAASAELKNLQRSADQPQVRQTSRDYIVGVNQDAQSANQQRIFYNEMADIVSKAATGKLLAAPGPGYEFTSNVIGALNRAVRAIPGLEVGENFFGNAKEYNDIMKKLTTLQAQARAQGAGQKAVGALIENLEALPSLDKEPGAAAQVASQNMVTNQKSLDRKLHADQWGKYSRGIYSGTMGDFEKKNDSSKYAQEQDAIRRMLLDTGDKEQRIAPGYAMFDMMKRGNVRPEDIDEYFEKRFNIPRSNNMSRYFVGAR